MKKTISNIQKNISTFHVHIIHLNKYTYIIRTAFEKNSEQNVKYISYNVSLQYKNCSFYGQSGN